MLKKSLHGPQELSCLCLLCSEKIIMLLWWLADCLHPFNSSSALLHTSCFSVECSMNGYQCWEKFPNPPLITSLFDQKSLLLRPNIQDPLQTAFLTNLVNCKSGNLMQDSQEVSILFQVVKLFFPIHSYLTQTLMTEEIITKVSEALCL